MLRRTVTAPDGRRWTLGRRWLPRRKRLGRAELPEIAPEGGRLDIGPVGAAWLPELVRVIALLFVVLLVLVLALNVFVIALELLVVALLALAGVIARVVFRRPWIVFARSDQGRLEWPVVGYFNSRRKLAELARDIALGKQLQAPAGHR